MSRTGARKRLERLYKAGMLTRPNTKGRRELVVYSLAPVDIKKPINRPKVKPPETEFIGAKVSGRSTPSGRRPVRSSNAELQKVLDIISGQVYALGGTMKKTGGNHIKIDVPGRGSVVTSATPSSSSAIPNFKSRVQSLLGLTV